MRIDCRPCRLFLLLLGLCMLLHCKPIGGAMTPWGLRRMRFMRWLGGHGRVMRMRINELEEELRNLHLAHRLLMDEVRQLRSKRAKDFSEYQKHSVTQSQEVQRVTSQLKAEAADELRRVEARHREERKNLEAQLIREVEEEKKKLETQMRVDVEEHVDKAVKKALDEQARKHREELLKMQAGFERRLKEQIKAAEEELARLKKAAGQEEKENARIGQEMEELRTKYEKELSLSKKKLKQAAEGEQKLRKQLSDKVKEYEERISGLQSQLSGKQSQSQGREQAAGAGKKEPVAGKGKRPAAAGPQQCSSGESVGTPSAQKRKTGRTVAPAGGTRASLPPNKLNK